MNSIWEKASQALDSIPNPKEHLSSFVDKVTQLDEKVSEYLVPQLQEVSGPALRFFQKIKIEQEVEQEWANEVEEKLNLSQQAVEELNKCTKKVKELLDTFQEKTNLRWSQPQTNWRTKYNQKGSPPPGEDAPKEVWYAWLTQKLTQILEFVRDEVMPVMVCYSAVPVTLIVIITTLCPPLAHSAPIILGGLATGVGSIYSLNKVLPALIDMLKNAHNNKGANSISNSSIDKLKNFMSSLQRDSADN